ncbi:MAG: hypothetical protein ACR2IT_04750 [Pirellulales bacterium]
MNRSDRESLHPLLSAVVDGTASEAQVAELARVLHASDEARRFYVRYLDMHAALTSGQLPRATVRFHRTPWWKVIGASLIAASLLGAWLVMRPLSREGAPDRAGEPADVGVAAAKPAPAGYVATIASASTDAVLDGAAVVQGSRLTPGAYHLTTGGVSIRFDGGARILLEGNARFAIDSRRAMKVHEGTFVFHGDQTCESIEIVTPQSVFKNIGTRYAGVINAGREEVHVAEGAVRRTAGNPAESTQHELIEAGVGRFYDVAEAKAGSIPLDAALATRSLDDRADASSAGRPTAWDDFRGGATPINGLKSGAGWVGPWESRRGDVRIVSPGLSGEGSAAVLHDGASKARADVRSAAHRKLEAPIDLSTDGIWYVRFLVRRGPASARDEHRAMIVLRTRGLTTNEELDRSALMQIALRKHDGVLLRVADTLTRASLPQIPDQAYAVVAKIVAGRFQPDQVLVSLMAAERLAGSPEPTEWSLVSEDVYSDLRFEKLSLEFTSSGQIATGDLCIGPTWASVSQPLGR